MVRFNWLSTTYYGYPKNQLKSNNNQLRDALSIAKGLLDAMKFSDEEPHEGSYGWVIAQALLSSTVQSLDKHTNETIEKCALICDAMSEAGSNQAYILAINGIGLYGI